MNLFFSEVITPPTHLPVTVDSAQNDLARAIVEEVERLVLHRAIAHQTRKITIDGPLDFILELEPTTVITSLTRWTSADPAEVIDEVAYDVVSRDPFGTVIAPANGFAWPEPERNLASFALLYECGWEVTDSSNLVPASIQHMLTRAVEHRAGAGLGNIQLGSLQWDVAASYKTDAIPREITNIARAFVYRPGLFIGRP